MQYERPEISKWLDNRGNQPAANDKDRFDSKINRDSVFDAMETGEFDMDALIKDVLKEE